METKEKTIPFGASTLENIDTAMYSYVDKELNLHANFFMHSNFGIPSGIMSCLGGL